MPIEDTTAKCQEEAFGTLLNQPEASDGLASATVTCIDAAADVVFIDLMDYLTTLDPRTRAL